MGRRKAPQARLKGMSVWERIFLQSAFGWDKVIHRKRDETMAWTERDTTKIKNGLVGLGSSAAIRSVVGSAMNGLDYVYHENPRVLILEIIRVAEDDDSKNENIRYNWCLGRCYKILQAIEFVQG